MQTYFSALRYCTARSRTPPQVAHLSWQKKYTSVVLADSHVKIPLKSTCLLCESQFGVRSLARPFSSNRFQPQPYETQFGIPGYTLYFCKAFQAQVLDSLGDNCSAGKALPHLFVKQAPRRDGYFFCFLKCKLINQLLSEINYTNPSGLILLVFCMVQCPFSVQIF